jgi:hypothetical protein
MTATPYQIDVDLEVFKALTARIETHGQTHNDVVRELLHLDSLVEYEGPQPLEGLSRVAEALARSQYAGQFYSRGLVLPDGTELRARYKGREYQARIEGDKWISSDGEEQSSPSAAASAITGTTVNGWRFWEARRPGEKVWRRLDILNAK